ncbi:MAG: YggS family pyridoxal phosphate-dependent enzyme [Actinobacteria bacterium]|nr:YggS family pyridoxal phosphate-dependent enzyme [Actinomycetota bacterium]
MSNRKSEITQNLQEVKERISAAAKSVNRDPAEINLIVVTKTFPISDIKILCELGESNFGENRDQEAGPKAELISATWHFQGQIQSNKIKSICGWADVIHSISSEKEILKFAQSSRKHQVFLQVSLDGEEGRGGANPAELAQLADLVNQSNNLDLLGLMAVAPLGVEPMKAFADLAQINQGFVGQYPNSKFLSVGMSGDFEAAIKYGATHIRVGSSILGSRSPH